MAAKRVDQVRKALLEQVFWRQSSPVASVASEFGLTRQAVHLHLKSLTEEGMIAAHGKGRWRRYELVTRASATEAYDLAPGMSEDSVWESLVRPRVDGLPPAGRDICAYGVTEMVNNAIDHSAGERLHVAVHETAISLTLWVTDNGIGMFQKIAGALGLADPRQALLELSKGKFTTDPARHTGEGVFFTSRAFDRFSIRSSDMLFVHTAASDDWLVEVGEKTFVGTRVAMTLLLPPARTLESVFSRFSSGPDDYRFAKTHVPLKLATYGDESLVSRSSAKRVLGRVERFDEVLLDFDDVRSIGQSFADEIFRVFATAHPGVRLIAINANEQVTSMIRRAEAARGEQAR